MCETNPSLLNTAADRMPPFGENLKEQVLKVLSGIKDKGIKLCLGFVSCVEKIRVSAHIPFLINFE